MANEIQRQKEQTLDLAKKVAQEQAHTLAMHRIDPGMFRDTLVEALVNNPNILKANQGDLARALRQSCQDGMLPNGREAAIIVNRDGSVRFLAMRDGVCKMAHRLLRATIKSGFVRAGQQVEVVQRTDGDDSVQVNVNFGEEVSEEIVGAWCWVKVPGQDAFVHIFRKDDIRNARAASNVKSAGGPWDVWTGRMAEKAVVKSAIRKALYMYPDVDPQAHERMSRYLGEDDSAEIAEIVTEAEIVDATAETVEVEAVEAEPVEEKKKAPPKRRTRKTGTSAKSKAAQKNPDPQPEVVEVKAVDENDDFDFGDLT